jgi:hypothetical protein
MMVVGMMAMIRKRRKMTMILLKKVNMVNQRKKQSWGRPEMEASLTFHCIYSTVLGELWPKLIRIV